MERAGLPPLAVINAATGTSAGRLGFREKFGRIERGYLSRFILTRHSPLTSVANMRRGKTVVFDGQVFESGDSSDTPAYRAFNCEHVLMLTPRYHTTRTRLFHGLPQRSQPWLNVNLSEVAAAPA